MKVHHLNCASLCPPLGKIFVNDEGRMVCHCLLIESTDGLILVDTGISVAEHLDPGGTLGKGFVGFAGPRREPELAAVRQIARLGFDPGEVRHIIVTHLDLDHAGGIPDFPGAKVHVFEPELDAALARSTFKERNRYKPHQLRAASFVRHAADGQGDRWFGFQAVKPLPDLGDIAIIPLLGHTQGHCGVAVRASSGWLLHCGDAYFYDKEMDTQAPRCSPGLRLFQRLVAMDNAARVANQGRLRDLAREHGREVTLFCAHDPKDFARFASPTPGRLFA